MTQSLGEPNRSTEKEKKKTAKLNNQNGGNRVSKLKCKEVKGRLYIVQGSRQFRRGAKIKKMSLFETQDSEKVGIMPFTLASLPLLHL